MSDSFPQLSTAIQAGIDRKLHSGVQVYVSIAGKVELDQGFGESATDVPLDSSAIMLWRSAGKPITATAIMQLIDEGTLSLQTTMSEVLPETESTPCGSITIQQLLTHTSGMPLIDTGWPHASWDQILQKIISTKPLQENDAAYQPQSTWFLLGEILRRVSDDGRSFSQVLHDRILKPLNLNEVWCGIPEPQRVSHADRIATLYERTGGQLQPSDCSSGLWLTQASPGGNLRGPIRGLGHFYEMLMRNGVAAGGNRIISEQAVQQMTSRHRVNQFDTTLQHVVDFGLGMIINSNQYGEATVPYGFGKYSSADSFGHGGSQCSIGFCDPKHQLVVAWAANAFCGEGQHQRRNRAINEAIYHDLGLIS